MADPTPETTAPAQPAPPVAEVAAPDLSDAPYKDLGALSPTEYEDFRATGNLPKVEPAKPDAEDPILKQFVKTPPPPGVSKRQHERNELIRAATEAQQRAADLEAKLRTPAPQPVRQPAPVAKPADAQPEWDGTDPNDPAPRIEDFATAEDPYRAHLKAEFRWEQRKEQRVAQFQETQARIRTEAESRAKGYAERVQSYVTEHADWPQKTAAIRAAIDPESPMAADLQDSPYAAQILEHFADHPDDFDRIARSPVRTALREFAKLEQRFEGQATTPPPAATTAPAPKPAKVVTSAPPPPTTLGTRPAEPADEADAALRRDDMAAFIEIENRKELARMAGR